MRLPPDREAAVLAGALRLLKLRGIPAFRVNAGMAFVKGRPIRLAPAGCPDIIAVLPPAGRLVGIETKRKGGRLRPAQRAFLEAVRAAGGVVIVADDLAELDRRLAALLS